MAKKNKLKLLKTVAIDIKLTAEKPLEKDEKSIYKLRDKPKQP
jgi:hypothetical protein